MATTSQMIFLMLFCEWKFWIMIKISWKFVRGFKSCYLFNLHMKLVNSSSLEQNGCHFVDDSFKCILLYEKFPILIKILLNFIPKGPFDNNAALVYIMSWCWIGNKPLSEGMLTQFTAAPGGDEIMNAIKKKTLIFVLNILLQFYFCWSSWAAMACAKFWLIWILNCQITVKLLAAINL